MRCPPATATCLILWFAMVAAGAQPVAKSDYSLFLPVPENQLRPLSSEVYDGVMDARTLDAGHFQVAGGLVNYYFNSVTPYGYSSRGFSWDPRISVGLLNNVAFYVRPSYQIKDYGSLGTVKGFGNVNTGVEVNLWGNDGGTTAFAIKPYLSIPTEGGDVLGGTDLGLLVRLPLGFELKFDSEFYATEDYYHTLFPGFYNAMSINKNLGSKIDAYCYLNSTVTSESNARWYGYAGFGASYNFTRNLQVSAGIGFGLTSWAYDYNPRLSCVWRF